VNNETIAKRIKTLRTLNGMSQRSLADQLGITAVTVSDYERGRVDLNLSKLVELSRIFNISIHELLSESEQQDDVPKRKNHKTINEDSVRKIVRDEIKQMLRPVFRKIRKGISL
jgi:transcriptional regulator with XRE-family HTH domain